MPGEGMALPSFRRPTSRFVTGLGTSIFGVHAPTFQCLRDGCVIHNPTDPRQHMPTDWIDGQMIRVCAHGKHHVDLNHRQFVSQSAILWSSPAAVADPECACCCCPLPQLPQHAYRVTIAEARSRHRALCYLCKTVVEVRAPGELRACPCGNLLMHRYLKYTEVVFDKSGSLVRLFRYPKAMKGQAHTDPYTAVVRWPDGQVGGYTPEEYAVLLADSILLGTDFPVLLEP